jgi:transcriptional regulator with XRE-family HTH domain
MTTKQKHQLRALAKRIKAARTSAHLSQQELGTSIGVSDKSVSAYEQGRSTPSVEKLKKIAESTSHPLSYFTEEQVNQSLIATKLATVEKELAEIKKLLEKASK